MNRVNDLLKKRNILPKKYIKKGKVVKIETDQESFIVKKEKITKDVYNYLKSRNFDYMPKRLTNIEEPEQIMEYIDSYNIPVEQKAIDMIDLVSLLHNKTTHYKEIDSEMYQKIYNDLDGNLEYLYNYYTDMITLIESKEYMSPSEYLLARNISNIYNSIDFSKKHLDTWFAEVKDEKKARMVVLHNNLSLDHFIRNDNSYLISWGKSKIDMPIFDLYKLYKNHALDLDFSSLLERYETNYPLLKCEKDLLYILVSIPEIIEFKNNELQTCESISNKIDVLYKTYELVSPYYLESAES